MLLFFLNYSFISTHHCKGIGGFFIAEVKYCDNATMVLHTNISHLCRTEPLAFIVSGFRIEVQMTVRITVNSSTIIRLVRFSKIRPQRMGFQQSLQCQIRLVKGGLKLILRGKDYIQKTGSFKMIQYASSDHHLIVLIKSATNSLKNIQA